MAKICAAMVCWGLLPGVAHADNSIACASDDDSCSTTDEINGHWHDEDVDNTAYLQKQHPEIVNVDVADLSRRRRSKQPPPCDAIFKTYEPLKFPTEVRSPVTLIAGTTPLCVPGEGNLGVWYTRGYALPGGKASITGPTIVTRPGENLLITVKNRLQHPSPSCFDPQVVRNTEEYEKAVNETCQGCVPGSTSTTNVIMYCNINTTNLHTHGMHVSPIYPGDDIFVYIEPNQKHTLNITLPPNHGSGNMWYHPHVHHSTRAQAGGGMAGAILVEDPPNKLPKELDEMKKVLLFIQLLDMRVENRSGSGFKAPRNAAGKNIGVDIGLDNNPGSEMESAGNLWSVDGKLVYGDNYYLFTNGQYKPSYSITESTFYRFQITFASIASNVVLKTIPKDAESEANGFQCEFGLIAKDGVYLNVAPRPVEYIYLSMGARAEVVTRCWCTKPGECIGSLISQPCVGSPSAPGGPKHTDDMKDTDKVQTSLCGPFNMFNTHQTLTQELLQLRVVRNCKKTAPIQQFEVSRPCYLADTRKGTVHDSTVIVMASPGPPTSPQYQAVFITTPEKRLKDYEEGTMTGYVFQEDIPPIKYLQVGTLHELWLDGGVNESDPKKGSMHFNYPLPPGSPDELFPNRSQVINGANTHAFHIHINPYQVTEMKCSDGRWITEGGCRIIGSNLTDNYFQVGDWHDNLMIVGGAFKARFQTSTFTGRYIFHCHILAHEDGGMMGYFQVYGKEGTEYDAQKLLDPSCYKGLEVPKYKYVVD